MNQATRQFRAAALPTSPADSNTSLKASFERVPVLPARSYSLPASPFLEQRPASMPPLPPPPPKFPPPPVPISDISRMASSEDIIEAAFGLPSGSFEATSSRTVKAMRSDTFSYSEIFYETDSSGLDDVLSDDGDTPCPTQSSAKQSSHEDDRSPNDILSSSQGERSIEDAVKGSPARSNSNALLLQVEGTETPCGPATASQFRAAFRQSGVVTNINPNHVPSALIIPGGAMGRRNRRARSPPADFGFIKEEDEDGVTQEGVTSTMTRKQGSLEKTSKQCQACDVPQASGLDMIATAALKMRQLQDALHHPIVRPTTQSSRKSDHRQGMEPPPTFSMGAIDMRRTVSEAAAPEEQSCSHISDDQRNRTSNMDIQRFCRPSRSEDSLRDRYVPSRPYMPDHLNRQNNDALHQRSLYNRHHGGLADSSAQISDCEGEYGSSDSDGQRQEAQQIRLQPRHEEKFGNNGTYYSAKARRPKEDLVGAQDALSGDLNMLPRSPDSSAIRKATGALRVTSAFTSLPFASKGPSNDNGPSGFPKAALESKLYRKVDTRSDLFHWAPVPQPDWSDSDKYDEAENLPKWTSIKPGDPTSRPIKNVEVDMQWSMQRLLNEDVLRRLLDDPLGRHRFREYLQREGCEMLLDFYCDLGEYEAQQESRKQITEAVYEAYISEDSDTHVDLPAKMNDDLFSTLRQAFELKAAFSPVKDYIRQSLYNNQFQCYIKSILVEEYRVKIGNFEEDEAYTGLSDCFCLTNPRIGTENPIVLVSDGFVEVTGYSRQSILGRNCRFLQGPATSPESVDRIRRALNAGRGCTELLLNYRMDGTPFFCLLSIVPLRDARGQLAYFIGGQCNVSGTLASAKSLGFLVGSTYDRNGKAEKNQSKDGFQVSPTLARQLANLDTTVATDAQSVKSASTRRNGPRMYEGNRSQADLHRIRTAAGAYDPNVSRGPDGAPLLSDLSNHTNTGGSSRLMARLLGRNAKPAHPLPHIRTKAGPAPSSSSLAGGQRLLGAEDTLRQAAPARLQDQMSLFSNLYSRMIIFKRHKREVIFVTRPLLHSLGLSCSTDEEVYNSCLLHCDVLSLLEGASRQETRALRSAVQGAIRDGQPISVMTGLRRRPAKTGMGRLLARDHQHAPHVGAGETTEGASSAFTKYTALHITPLFDLEDSTFAFVAVLGSG